MSHDIKHKIYQRTNEGETGFGERDSFDRSGLLYTPVCKKTNHGYGIIQEVEKLTGGRGSLGPGTLYGAIQTLQKKEWIRIYSVDTQSQKKKKICAYRIGKGSF